MNSNEQQQLKGIIDARIHELKDLVSSNGSLIQEKSEELTDEATRNDTLANLSVDSALLVKSRSELASLRQQLQRIENGTIGECVECGADIPSARQLMVPTTTLCIHCAEKKEQRR